MNLVPSRLGALVVAAALVATGALAAAAGAGRPLPAKTAKLSSELVQVLRAELDRGRGVAVAREQGLQVVRGRIRVVVEANGTRAAVANAVRSTGGTVEAWHAGLTQALVPPAALAPLSRSAAVAYVRAPKRLVVQ